MDKLNTKMETLIKKINNLDNKVTNIQKKLNRNDLIEIFYEFLGSYLNKEKKNKKTLKKSLSKSYSEESDSNDSNSEFKKKKKLKKKRINNDSEESEKESDRDSYHSKKLSKYKKDSELSSSDSEEDKKKKIKRKKDKLKTSDSDIFTEYPNEKVLKDKVEKIDNFYSKKQCLMNNNILNLDSLILGNNQEYKKTLKSWINSNENIKSKLLYRMTKDGKNFSTFHSLCDNKGPTLTLIKIIDGDIIGMYTPLSWETQEKEKKDSNIFIFSLTKNLKIMENMKSSGSGMYCKNELGPCSEYMGFMNNRGMNYVSIFPGIDTFLGVGKFGLKETTYLNSEVEIFEIIIE